MTTVQRKYTPPTFEMMGDKKRLTKAVWNHDTMAHFVQENGVDSWITVGDLARAVWDRNSAAHRQAVRQRLPALKRHMALTCEQLLVVEYNDVRGAASAVKVYDHTVEADVQAMERMLRSMRDRRDGMLQYYQKITGLSGIEPDNGA